MLRRRPAAVYELLAEDELLERGHAAGRPERERDDGAVRGYSHEPGAAAASAVAAPAPTARRALLVALVAAALVGFAVWELLGIASDSVANRPGAAFQGLRADVNQPRQLDQRQSHAPRRVAQSRAVPRPVHAQRRPATPARARTGKPAVPAPPLISSSAIAPDLSATPSAPTSPAPTTSTPLAEQEFGFER